jgi:L-rhamnose isomerase
VTRPVNWDSDHVVLLQDELIEVMKEVVRNDALDKVILGLDFFDAYINRVAAWVIGTRATQKALLLALLQPNEELKKAQDDADYTKRLMLSEEMKSLPWSDVWAEYCKRENVPADKSWYDEIKRYEQEVLSKRA